MPYKVIIELPKYNELCTHTKTEEDLANLILILEASDRVVSYRVRCNYGDLFKKDFWWADGAKKWK